MAGILHEFVQNTKILASQVNENFDVVQGDIEELGNGLNTKFSSEITKAKEELIDDINTKTTTLANKDLSNVPNEKSILTNKATTISKWNRQYSDGFVIQGGEIEAAALGAEVFFSFEVKMSTVLYFSPVNYAPGANSEFHDGLNIKEISSTGVKIWVGSVGEGSVRTTRLKWIAIGYK